MATGYRGSGDRNSNYCSRVQNVFLVVTVTTLSAHFAGCNLSNLSGCTDPIPFYKSSTSLLFFYLFSSVFEISLNVSWQVTEFVAFTFALLYYFYAPLSFHEYTVEMVKYLALLWLCIQGLIIIDIAHESHLYIIKRAELAFNFRGIQASKPWYLLHMVLSAALCLIAASSLNLMNSQCGYCVENEVVISLITCAALLSIYFSLLEQCNKGGLIPAIVFCYSVLLSSNALWSNPNAICNSLSIDAVMYRNTAKVSTSWLLLLTAITSAIYTAVTGSPTVLLIFKSLRSIAGRKTSTSIFRNNCISSGTCCHPILGDDKHFEQTLDNDPESSLPLAYFENHSHTIMAGNVEVSRYSASEQGYSSSFTGSSVLHLDRCPPGMHIAGASSSGTGGDSAGENTSLLRDHRLLLMSTDPDFVPCSSVSADDLLSNNSILFKAQMGLATCYICVILSDWSALSSDVNRLKSAEKDAMIMKLIGSFFVWILYAFVLLNSYIIYRQYNMKLRDFIRT